MKRLPIIVLAVMLSACFGQWEAEPEPPMEVMTPTEFSEAGRELALECLELEGFNHTPDRSPTLFAVLTERPFYRTNGRGRVGLADRRLNRILIWHVQIENTELWAHEYAHIFSGRDEHPDRLFDCIGL